jgi:hypothetical protein
MAETTIIGFFILFAIIGFFILFAIPAILIVAVLLYQWWIIRHPIEPDPRGWVVTVRNGGTEPLPLPPPSVLGGNRPHLIVRPRALPDP